MIVPRKRILQLAACTLAMSSMLQAALAQTYPTRPIRLVVGTAAGGSSDLVGRLIAQWLTDRLGQKVLVENRTGAGTTIAIDSVVTSSPDGYTLLLTGSVATVADLLYEKIKFDFRRDIAPVASIMRTAYVLEVNLAFPAKTLSEFVTYARANPGKVNVANPGMGTGPHLAGELLKQMAGIDVQQVPYRGTAPAHSDLIGGQVQALVDGIPGSIEFIRANKLRALAVTSATRSEALPDVPTISESIPGYEASGWWGIGAPRGSPPEVVERLNREINAGLTDPKLSAKLLELGGKPLVGNAASFQNLIAEDSEKWRKLVRAIKVKPQ